MNKRNLMFFTAMSLIVIFIVSAFVFSDSSEKNLTELPREYHVYGNNDTVKISLTLGVNARTI